MLTSLIRREDRQGGKPRTRSTLAAAAARGQLRRRPALERLEELALLSAGAPRDLALGIGIGGLAGGAVLVDDLMPGPNGAFPSSLVNASGTLYFLSVDQTRSVTPLWTTDGTAAGTIDLTPGLEASNPLAREFGRLHGVQPDRDMFSVWTSDGTVAGTHQLATLPRSSTSDTGVSAGGVVFFDLFNNVTSKTELWKSDGTPGGTGFVANIPEPVRLRRRRLEGLLRRLRLHRRQRALGERRTAGGTHRVADINPGPNGSFPAELTAVGGTVFFTASSSFVATQLWQKPTGRRAGPTRSHPACNRSTW